ncbi:MAG TPA: polyhydroxyalkanoate synthesis regulator DNA-binding domain-containing protein [Kofleriaceae bacterium]|nr:polyhydroxyalkanoate synthesis regulator DNA-binding domain-containing protein [Kofleriaceae bacterium]
MATVVIKKYGNRRLYDTGDSRYVTLDELAAKIRTGVDLRIVDAQTNEDLTQATLTQIVLETGHASKFLPVQLLTQMIRLSDDSLAEFFSRYVTGALDMYLQAKRGVQAITTYNPLAQIPMAATDALTRMWMGSAFGGGPQYGAPPPQYGYPAPPPYPVASPPAAPEDETEEAPASNGDSRDDVAAMRRELDELKQAVRESLPKKKKKKS